MSNREPSSRGRSRGEPWLRACWILALAAGCHATPRGAEARLVSSVERDRALPGSRALPFRPIFGLHVLDADEPFRERPAPRVVPRIVEAPAARPTAAPPRGLSAAPAPEPPRLSSVPPPLLERRSMPSEYDWPLGPGVTLERIGRGMTRDEDGLSNFAFLRLLDRFHRPAPDAGDPLEITREDAEFEERDRFLHSRSRQAVTARLRDAVDETELVGSVVRGAELLPQSGITVLETVVGEVTGGEEGPDFGELRLRSRGGLMRSPSRMLSLNYSLGALDADFFPTQAKVRIGRSIAGFRFAVRGEVDYGSLEPTARLEVTRRIGREWRLRFSAGSGVGYFSIPVFTPWPGDGSDSDARRGVVAFFERRF